MSETIRITGQLKKHLDRTISDLGVEVTHQLMAANPVATGWSQANWIPSIGSPVTSPEGSRHDFTGAAQDQGLALISAAYKQSQGPIFVSNNVYYIGDLNKGSSSQAPAGWIETARDQAMAIIRAKH